MASQEVTKPIPEVRDRKIHYSLLYGVLAGPVIWSLYFLIGYGYTEVACKAPMANLPIWLYTAASPVVIVLTVISTLPIVYGGWLAYKFWHNLNNVSRDVGDAYDPDGRNRFLAILGILTSILFALVTFLTGTAALVLEIC